jgi:uncharacterized protein involved in exopolysaccharide biosynthesis
MTRVEDELGNQDDAARVQDEISFARVVGQLGLRWKRNLGIVILGAAAGIGVSFLVTPKYTATSLFMPPQQQQGGAAAALASLGSLSSLVGAGGSARSSPDQYIALMQSVTVSDHIIKKFNLKSLWDLDYEVDARKKLAQLVEITTNKKDGLITVRATDPNPVRAAAIANQYVEELRLLMNGIAVTEAQQRRVFFEHLLEQTRDKLTSAQTALEASGYNAGALNAEPRAAAEGYAQVQAQQTAAEVKLRVLRSTLADGSPEVERQRETVNALTAQLAKLEASDRAQPHSGDYINHYREYKYQETLFDLFAKQYESARVDESREGALVQVIDPATPPERKSAPTRKFYLAAGGLLALLALAWRAIVVLRREAATPKP